MSQKKVCILADVQNIYYTTRQRFSCSFNYNRFWADATDNRQVVQAYAYAIDRGDEKQRQFQNILKAIGFEVKLKPFIQRADGSAKGDWDVGITVDAMKWANEIDVLVLLSGDGDFDILAQTLRTAYAVEVEVYGVSDLTAKSLIDQSSRYIPIDGELLLR